jgi:hypothetical protein
MAWADLTPEQQSNVQQADRFFRGFLSTLASDDIDLKIQWYIDNIIPALALMDVGELIPKSDSLAGSVALTHEQLTTIATWVKVDMSDKIETNKSLVVKAIGVNA